MSTVRELLKTKNQAIWSINPDTSVKDALKLLAEKEIGALLVIEAGKTVGILSERDYARQMVIRNDIRPQTPIKELMTHPIFYVTPEQTLDECMAFMTEKRFRHLPIMDGEQLVGIVSIGDIVKQLILERDITIKDLEDYIWVNMI
jgi:CBS domain-containing protein